MGPRSPAGSDSPLSLVISGRRDRDDLAIHHKTPPPVPIFAVDHQGSSSGFSEEGESPHESPRHRHEVHHPQDHENEQPLSLVVPKKNYDSGHDSEETSRSPKLQLDQGTVFKRFCKVLLDVYLIFLNSQRCPQNQRFRQIRRHRRRS